MLLAHCVLQEGEEFREEGVHVVVYILVVVFCFVRRFVQVCIPRAGSSTFVLR